MTSEKCFFIHLTDAEAKTLNDAADILRDIEDLAFNEYGAKSLVGVIGSENSVDYLEDDIGLAKCILADFSLANIIKEGEEE